MRNYDYELLSAARIKKGADDRIIRRIDSGVNAARTIYGLMGGVVALAIWLATLRSDVNNQKEDLNRFKDLLNQVYEREFGVKISFR